MNSQRSYSLYFICERRIRGCSPLSRLSCSPTPSCLIHVIICVEMAHCIQCGRQLPALTFGKKICRWCVQHEAAQRGEDSAIQRVEPAPWTRQQSGSMVVTQAIFGINVAVFIAMTMAGVSMLDNPAGPDLVRWGANL